jgi:pimeloyl-ACP methyl ester carboxylesterase
MRVREYGRSGPLVIVVHGGPGAPGSAASLARELAIGFRVLEPLQRGSGPEPLTVARHVADLQELVASLPERPVLLGHSWGAMLVLAHAAAHPDHVGPLVLVGCGTFDRAARERMYEIREQRMDDAMKARLRQLDDQPGDADRRLRAKAELMQALESCELATGPLEAEDWDCDARANHETWEDMLHLQREGVYPRAFTAIRSPVLMAHGAQDTHPGPMIRVSLERHIPQLEYREWPRCGHYPWLETAAREDFLATVSEWIRQRLSRAPASDHAAR